MQIKLFSVLSFLFPGLLLAQGQDSASYERDLQVIRTMLPGIYDNANQSYFDRRGDRSVKHRRIHMAVTIDAEDPNRFRVETFWDDKQDTPDNVEIWQLATSPKTNSVKMTISTPGDKSHKNCERYWQREAQQFRARVGEKCKDDFAAEFVLGYDQFWVDYPKRDGGNYQLHRARAFECYADIPGVGGGRDEPYERYEGFKIHDQGGAVWFDSKDGRRLGISLFLVDWPINNYEGIFTRDSFVIYVSEEIDGERKEHGYAFTVPSADRIGINLKWMLASCFMKSNKFATPFM